MDWNRLAKSLLLCSGLSVVGSGCAAYQALVHSSAGSSATSNSPDRLTSIGRVFENQGQLAHAEAMYRRALKADPRNTVARERMDFIASMRSEKQFKPQQRPAESAIAAADAVKPPQKPSAPKPAVKAESSPVVAKHTPARPAPREMETALDNSAVLNSLKPIEMTAHSPEMKPAASSIKHAFDAQSQDKSSAVLSVGSLGDFATIAAPLVRPVASPLLPNKVAVNKAAVVVQPLVVSLPIVSDPSADADADAESEEYAEQEYYEAETVNVDSVDAEENTALIPLITLGQVSEWMESPLQYKSELLTAIQHGEDDGVKALAATMMTECPQQDRQIDAILEEAAVRGSDLLKVTALDAMLQRGTLRKEGVDQLLLLMHKGDFDVRTQAAASLRNCAGTNWVEPCVTGLITLLSDSEPDVVAVAASTLGDFGSGASASADHLARIADQSEDTRVREAAKLALSRIQSTKKLQRVGYLPTVDEINDRVSNGVYLPVVE